MKFKVTALTVLLMAILIHAEPVNAPPELSDAWIIQTLTKGGGVQNDAVGKQLTIRGHELVSDLDPGNTAIISVDASKEPGWFDITDGDQIVQKGIYKIDGDTLTLCMAAEKSERPREFASPAGSSATLIVATRKVRVEVE